MSELGLTSPVFARAKSSTVVEPNEADFAHEMKILRAFVQIGGNAQQEEVSQHTQPQQKPAQYARPQCAAWLHAEPAQRGVPKFGFSPYGRHGPGGTTCSAVKKGWELAANPEALRQLAIPHTHRPRHTKPTVTLQAQDSLPHATAQMLMEEKLAIQEAAAAAAKVAQQNSAQRAAVIYTSMAGHVADHVDVSPWAVAAPTGSSMQATRQVSDTTAVTSGTARAYERLPGQLGQLEARATWRQRTDTVYTSRTQSIAKSNLRHLRNDISAVVWDLGGLQEVELAPGLTEPATSRQAKQTLSRMSEMALADVLTDLSAMDEDRVQYQAAAQSDSEDEWAGQHDRMLPSAPKQGMSKLASMIAFTDIQQSQAALRPPGYVGMDPSLTYPEYLQPAPSTSPSAGRYVYTGLVMHEAARVQGLQRSAKEHASTTAATSAQYMEQLREQQMQAIKAQRTQRHVEPEDMPRPARPPAPPIVTPMSVEERRRQARLEQRLPASVRGNYAASMAVGWWGTPDQVTRSAASESRTFMHSMDPLNRQSAAVGLWAQQVHRLRAMTKEDWDRMQGLAAPPKRKLRHRAQSKDTEPPISPRPATPQQAPPVSPTTAGQPHTVPGLQTSTSPVASAARAAPASVNPALPADCPAVARSPPASPGYGASLDAPELESMMMSMLHAKYGAQMPGRLAQPGASQVAALPAAAALATGQAPAAPVVSHSRALNGSSNADEAELAIPVTAQPGSAPQRSPRDTATPSPEGFDSSDTYSTPTMSTATSIGPSPCASPPSALEQSSSDQANGAGVAKHTALLTPQHSTGSEEDGGDVQDRSHSEHDDEGELAELSDDVAAFSPGTAARTHPRLSWPSHSQALPQECPFDEDAELLNIPAGASRVRTLARMYSLRVRAAQQADLHRTIQRMQQRTPRTASQGAADLAAPPSSRHHVQQQDHHPGRHHTVSGLPMLGSIGEVANSDDE